MFPDVSLKTWLRISNLAKSSFYEWVQKLNEIDHEEAKLINKIKLIIDKSKRRYRYRRVTLMLKNKGLVVNHKRVYRIMKEHNLLCDKFHRKTRKY